MGIDSLLLKFHSDFLKTEERDWMHVETESLAANGLAQRFLTGNQAWSLGEGVGPSERRSVSGAGKWA